MGFLQELHIIEAKSVLNSNVYSVFILVVLCFSSGASVGFFFFFSVTNPLLIA